MQVHRVYSTIKIALIPSSRVIDRSRTQGSNALLRLILPIPFHAPPPHLGRTEKKNLILTAAKHSSRGDTNGPGGKSVLPGDSCAAAGASMRSNHINNKCSAAVEQQAAESQKKRKATTTYKKKTVPAPTPQALSQPECTLGSVIIIRHEPPPQRRCTPVSCRFLVGVPARWLPLGLEPRAACGTARAPPL